jgi:hypothetical protein
MRKSLHTYLPVLIFLGLVIFSFQVQATGQEPIGTLEGFVMNEKGPVSGARIVLDIRTDKFRQRRIFFTNEDGSFRINSHYGEFKLIAEFKCTSLAKNVEIRSRVQPALTLSLPNEDCSAEAEVWNRCDQELKISGIEVPDLEKARIINLVLEDMLIRESENRMIVFGEKEILILKDSINPEWIKPIPGVMIKVLNKHEIKSLDVSGYGVSYFVFQGWTMSNNCISVYLNNEFEKGKKSEKFVRCLNGSVKKYAFLRTHETWNGPKVKYSF